MTFERLYWGESDLFHDAFALYESAFPICERRDASEQHRVLGNKDYQFNVIKENGEMVGIMFYWEIEDLIFLEHFSTLPTVRGKGIGAKALEILKSKGKTILLEIEPPEDDITIRRYNFYQRNGFVMNPYHHVQAKYHLGDEDCELKILSYPSLLSPEQYRGFYEYMTREIGIAPHKAEEFIVRPMIDGDDVRRGIAAMLVDNITKDRDYCTLECIVANSGTWRIYQRLGFKIAYEYLGVFKPDFIFNLDFYFFH